MSGLILWVSELILRVFGSGRVGSTGLAGSGGRPGRVSSTFGENPFWESVSEKKVSIEYIIEL